jgi:hypothetical protein
MGTEIFDEEIKQTIQELLSKYGKRLRAQKGKVDRCISIIEKIM